ncbi:uncharacterized protein OCT59_011864 [Rhizophagus irregularis]|uniref:uncharacterized protein n=1 Tax=Rhizophagus irregularis TaxID=588596 RepID=UPI0033229408|nr:hypothetical protein OCT59_011864 [Rhizophagus irregularis]
MKLIVFIIVLFLMFFKTFAFVTYGDCDNDGSIVSEIIFPAAGVVRLQLVQPDKRDDPNLYPCCLQQGVMLLENYMIYKDDGSKDPLFTFVGDRTWVNGYDGSNILQKDDDCDRSSFKCDQLYEGDYAYTRFDNFDASKLTPGDAIIVSMTTYSHCYYASETICVGSCKPLFHMHYWPLPN